MSSTAGTGGTVLDSHPAATETLLYGQNILLLTPNLIKHLKHLKCFSHKTKSCVLLGAHLRPLQRSFNLIFHPINKIILSLNVPVMYPSGGEE